MQVLEWPVYYVWKCPRTGRGSLFELAFPDGQGGRVRNRPLLGRQVWAVPLLGRQVWPRGQLGQAGMFVLG